MSVVVKEGQVRSTPTFLGQIVQILNYGERVTVLNQKNDWIEVGFPGGTGWMHKSALSQKKVVLSAGGSAGKTGASEDEIALAGKGFNAQVEARYKNEQNLDYTWIDTMETYVVSASEAADFLVQGDLDLDIGKGK